MDFGGLQLLFILSHLNSLCGRVLTDLRFGPCPFATVSESRMS